MHFSELCVCMGEKVGKCGCVVDGKDVFCYLLHILFIFIIYISTKTSRNKFHFEIEVHLNSGGDT